MGEIKDLSFVVLKLEIETLTRTAKERKLSVTESDSLVKYLKLIKELEKKQNQKEPDPEGEDPDETDALDQLSTEELKKIASKGDKP